MVIFKTPFDFVIPVMQSFHLNMLRILFLLVLSSIFFLILPLFLKLRHFTHALFMLVSTFISITTFMWLQFTSIHCYIIDNSLVHLPLFLRTFLSSSYSFFLCCQISLVMSIMILLGGISAWFWYLSCGITHEITSFDSKNAFHIHTINTLSYHI